MVNKADKSKPQLTYKDSIIGVFVVIGLFIAYRLSNPLSVMVNLAIIIFILLLLSSLMYLLMYLLKKGKSLKSLHQLENSLKNTPHRVMQNAFLIQQHPRKLIGRKSQQKAENLATSNLKSLNVIAKFSNILTDLNMLEAEAKNQNEVGARELVENIEIIKEQVVETRVKAEEVFARKRYHENGDTVSNPS